MYFRGALDSAQFFIAWEKQLFSIKLQQENLVDIMHKLLMSAKYCIFGPLNSHLLNF
jgi:hypothetical protein